MEKKNNKFLSFVSIFGTVWGVFEITVGTFLHITKIPFSSVIVVVIGAGVLIVERKICNIPGITLATGVIAALLKSLSPGGIIIGPMIGIIIESLILEIVFTLLGINVFSSVIGGMMGALWSMTQAVFMQYVYLGKNAIEIYLSLIKKSGTVGISLVGIYLFIPVMLGVFGGWYFFNIARRIEKRL